MAEGYYCRHGGILAGCNIIDVHGGVSPLASSPKSDVALIPSFSLPEREGEAANFWQTPVGAVRYTIFLSLFCYVQSIRMSRPHYLHFVFFFRKADTHLQPEPVFPFPIKYCTTKYHPERKCRERLVFTFLCKQSFFVFPVVVLFPFFCLPLFRLPSSPSLSRYASLVRVASSVQPVSVLLESSNIYGRKRTVGHTIFWLFNGV